MLSSRWTVGFVVAALALFAVSFAIARSGRPQAAPAEAAKPAPAKSLPTVELDTTNARLHTIGVQSLPALARTPEPEEPDTGGGGVTTPDTGGGGVTTPDTGGGGVTTPDTGGGGGTSPDTGGGGNPPDNGGCNPCG